MSRVGISAGGRGSVDTCFKEGEMWTLREYIDFRTMEWEDRVRWLDLPPEVREALLAEFRNLAHRQMTNEDRGKKGSYGKGSHAKCVDGRYIDSVARESLSKSVRKAKKKADKYFREEKEVKESIKSIDEVITQVKKELANKNASWKRRNLKFLRIHRSNEEERYQKLKSDIGHSQVHRYLDNLLSLVEEPTDKIQTKSRNVTNDDADTIDEEEAEELVEVDDELGSLC
jgi:hypothetical protein